MMRRVLPLLSIIFGVSLLSACAPASTGMTAVKGDKVDRSYSISRLSWQSGKGGVIAAVKSMRGGDNLVICGAWAERSGKENPDLTQKVISRAQVLIGEERILGDIRGFNRNQTANTLLNAPSNCFDTGIAWTEEYGRTRARVKYFTGTYITSS